MTIREMTEQLQLMGKTVGENEQVAVVMTNGGENDYLIPSYSITGDFEDQDGNTFKCAFVSTVGGEEFSARGIPHYEWNPKDNIPKVDGILHVKMKHAYPEDAIVNGERDSEVEPSIPGYDGKDEESVKWDIDVETGTILNWKKGTTASTHYKIVDEFEYDFRGFHYDDYVPDFMGIDDDSFGDYVCVTVDAEGRIKNWNKDKCLEIIKLHMDRT